MKKIALLALSLAFIFTLTACSPNANVSNQTDTNSSSSDTPADNTGSANTPKKIAMIMGQMNMDFFVYIAAGAEKAADELGVDLTVWNAASDIVKVGELVDLAAEQGFDAIITPDSTGSAKSAIEAAAGLGIPVVGYDSLAFPELFNATVASDSFEMGQQCANLAIEDAKQQGKDSVHFVIAYCHIGGKGMTSAKLKHRAKLQEWAARIQDCRSSGLSVRAWCRQEEINVTTYYRWERELLTAADTLEYGPVSAKASNSRSQR